MTFLTTYLLLGNVLICSNYNFNTYLVRTIYNSKKREKQRWYQINITCTKLEKVTLYSTHETPLQVLNQDKLNTTGNKMITKELILKLYFMGKTINVMSKALYSMKHQCKFTSGLALGLQ